ncbi:CVNH domain-containing protein [Microdochium nivale]|nr:CVNH domain-containing protein [Microdochium nivale]
MSFSQSSQCYRLEGSTLFAMCQRSDGNLVDSQIDLDNYIGNSDGEFAVGGSGWFESADPAATRLDGTVVITLLKREDGQYGSDQFVDLDDWITNSDGQLMWLKE